MKETLPSVSPILNEGIIRLESVTSLPTPPPLVKPVSINKILPKLVQFEPAYLEADNVAYHCLPGIGMIFEIAKKLEITAQPTLWTATGSIFEIKSSYEPSQVQPIHGMPHDSGYRAISLLLTRAEEYGVNIEMAVKNHFYDNYSPGKLSFNLLNKSM